MEILNVSCLEREASYTYTYTYVHIYIHIHIHSTYTYTYICTHTHIHYFSTQNTSAHTHTHTHTETHTRSSPTDIHTPPLAPRSLFLPFVYVHIYVFSLTQRIKHRNIKTQIHKLIRFLFSLPILGSSRPLVS